MNTFLTIFKLIFFVIGAVFIQYSIIFVIFSFLIPEVAKFYGYDLQRPEFFSLTMLYIWILVIIFFDHFKIKFKG